MRQPERRRVPQCGAPGRRAAAAPAGESFIVAPRIAPPVIRYQLTHTPGFDLRREIARRVNLPESGKRAERARRSGVRRIISFELIDRGTALRHRSPSYSGKITMRRPAAPGVTTGEIKIPAGAKDKRIMGSFVDLLYRHFPDDIIEVSFRF